MHHEVHQEHESALRIAQRARLLAAMFCLGAFSVITQVTFMREMLVVFFGNELSIGTILAGWLVGISLGAFSARFILGRISRTFRIEYFLTALLIVLSVTLPFQIYVVRTVRLLLRVPMGEYAPFGTILLSSMVIFFPTCFSIGLIFPFACEAFARGIADCGLRNGDCGDKRATAVSRIYMFEAMGSMLGGAILTYILLPAMSPYRVVLVAVCMALVGATMIVPRRVIRCVLLVCTICLAVSVLLYPGWLRSIERYTIKTRWRAFGILHSEASRSLSDSANRPEVKLLHSDNSIYQNLAITESEGQFALYANGQVMFVFPDPIGYEHSIHFVMAQKPGAKRVLLLGGNPVGDIPELLKYPIERLVYVELDQAVGRMVRKVMAEEYDNVLADSRVTCVLQDAPRFVQRCREQFDVILVNAPEPTTTGANRFYTLEFYRNIRRILAEDGFMYTAVTSSERLQSEAADLGASVYQTLKAMFPVVLVTAEAQNKFFAGMRNAERGAQSGGTAERGVGSKEHSGGLTFDREILVARSKSANLGTKFFRPEYFLGADEITPEKTRYVEERFATTAVPLNTNLKPVTYFYNLLLWSRFSDSRVEKLLGSIKRLSYRKLAKWLVLAGVICLLAGVIVRIRRRKPTPSLSPEGSHPGEIRRGELEEFPSSEGLGVGRIGGGWARLMIGVLIATTGFCGMALEILLIFVFQSLYGYVYTRMGLIVAMFMLGLVLGAPSGRMMAGGKWWCSWLAIAGLELVLVIFALAIPRVVTMASLPATADRLLCWYEIAIYLAVALVGWAVGAEFPLGNKLFYDAGGTVGTAAAITNASDHLGAAAGCLVMGTMLIPILGIGASCVVLAALKCASLLFLASALMTMPRLQG